MLIEIIAHGEFLAAFFVFDMDFFHVYVAAYFLITLSAESSFFELP